MAQRSNQDVAQLKKMRDQTNRIASANDEAVLKLSGAGLAVSFAIMRFLGNDATALISLQGRMGVLAAQHGMSVRVILVRHVRLMDTRTGEAPRSRYEYLGAIRREQLDSGAELRQRALLCCRAVRVCCLSVHEHIRR